jgi:DNA-binding LacI/PurR family transcriptional regulator
MTSDRLGDVVDRWRALSAPPTAVVCTSDTAAVAVLQECQRRDIAVPGQLSVIGYGDSALSRHVRPALSTLRLPAREVAQALTRSLFAALEGRSEPLPELHPKLVVRDSTGRAPK